MTQFADDWRRHGACLRVDPELFFPVGRPESVAPQIEQAKSVCRRCPVTSECLNWALQVRELDGVWGGTAPAERLVLLRDRRAPIG